MPINTSNKEVSLNKGTRKAKIPPIAQSIIKSLRDENESSTSNSEAAQQAFTEEENTKIYIALQNKGLNNLRSEIISVCEFIPISTEYSSEDSARMSRQIGENNSLSVTNIARLVELHRQIREYTTTAGEKLLAEIYPDIYSQGFLQWINSNVKTIFNSITSNDLLSSESQTALIRNIINTVIERLIDLGVEEYSLTVSNNSRNYYFLGLVEYLIYDNVIEEVIKYLGQIESLDKIISDYWGIDKSSSLKSFSSESAFANADKKISESFAISNTTIQTLPDTGLKNILGIVRDSNNSDTDMLLNAAGQLASILTLRDSSSVLSTLSTADDENLKVESGKIKIGIQSDLANAIAQLKYISLPGCLTLLGNGTDSERISRIQSVESFDSDEQLTKRNFKKPFTRIKTAQGTSRDDIITGAQELLVAACYDIQSFYIKMIGGSEGNSSEDKGYSIKDSLNGQNALQNTEYFRTTENFQVLSDVGFDKNIYYDFIEKNLGIDSSQIRIGENVKNASNVKLSREEIIPKNNDANISKPGFGAFIKNVLGYRDGIPEGNVKYLPLESLNYEEAEIPTLTGTKYFLESKIESAEFDVNDPNSELQTQELQNYASIYKRESNKFIENILTLFPDENITRQYNERGTTVGGDVGTIVPPTTKGSHKLTPLGTGNPKSILHLFIANFEKDLQNIIDNTDDMIPLLSIFLKGGTENELIRMFCQTLWGVILGPNELIADSSDASGLETILEYYIESVFGDYLNQLGLSPREGGSNAKGKFKFSGVEYTRYLGDPQNLFHKEQVANKIQGNKEINTRSLNIPIDGEIKSISIEATKIDDAFNLSLGNGSNVKDIDTEDDTAYGLFRLLENSFKFAAVPRGDRSSDLDLVKELEFPEPGYNFAGSGAGVPFRNIQRSAVGQRVLGKGYTRPSDGSTSFVDHSPARFGGILDLCVQHRVLIWFWWSRELLKKTLRVRASTNADGVLKLTIFPDQIKGVIDGLRQSRGLSALYELDTESYNTTKRSANLHSVYTIRKMDQRQESIRKAAAIYSAHADSIDSIGEKVKNIINGVNTDGSVNVKKSIAVQTLKENNVFSDTITLSSNFTPGQIYLNRRNIFTSRLNENSLLPNNAKYHLNKVNFLTSVLATKGYGLLKSEKRGNKSILNVGITNSMISFLQREKYQETGDINFLNSPYVCISVYKKDHFNPGYNFYPKNYVFDTSANILDEHINLGGTSNHIRNYSHSNNIDVLLKSVDITRLSFDRDGNIITSIKRGYPEGIFSKEVLINHVFDYCFKSYFSLTNSLSFNEDTFLLSKDILDMSSIQTTNFLGEELNKEYRRVLGEIRKRYPNAYLDSQLLSEVYRMQNIIKQSLPFSFANRYKKLILPKSFDKVYSILVNEKDFVLDTDKTIYVEEPKFYLNSKISRPDIDNAFFNLNEVKNYTKSLNENYPEVYNYHVVVSLLPIEFMPGADLKLPDANIKYSDSKIKRTPPGEFNARFTR